MPRQSLRLVPYLSLPWGGYSLWLPLSLLSVLSANDGTNSIWSRLLTIIVFPQISHCRRKGSYFLRRIHSSRAHLTSLQGNWRQVGWATWASRAFCPKSWGTCGWIAHFQFPPWSRHPFGRARGCLAAGLDPISPSKCVALFRPNLMLIKSIKPSHRN